MITDFLNFVASTISSAVAALPPFPLIIGNGTTQDALDNNTLITGLFYLSQFDKFIPLHDGFATWLSILGTYIVTTMAYRYVLLFVNVIRGSGAR